VCDMCVCVVEWWNNSRERERERESRHSSYDIDMADR